MLGKLKTLILKDYGYLKLFFIILCSLVLCEELYVFFFEKPTLTRIIKSELSQDHFPEVLICPQPNTDKDELGKVSKKENFHY